MVTDTIRTLLAHAFPAADIAVGEPVVARPAERRFKTDFETLEDLVEARA